jgi:tRNA(Leu) C34 or U34 (ribose-2'-O)-methylase TrmL
MNESVVNIGLINPKSPTNVGSVMRAAGCFNADSVFYTGKRYVRAAQYNTDTQHASRSVALVGVPCLLEDVPADMKIICVELVEGAIPLTEFQHPDKAYYIFGPEDGTIQQGVLDRSDSVIYVPTIGCLNLAATVNVVLYDRLAKSDSNIANDELIRQSRDVNNNRKLKKGLTVLSSPL